MIVIGSSWGDEDGFSLSGESHKVRPREVMMI